MSADQNLNTPLHKTPLHALHLELGAKMVPFAGYDMPVQYPAGVMAEHKHTRAQAGLFDVSHMGQVLLVGDDAAAALETLVPVDIVDLGMFKQRYALFTADDGGILDDLMVARRTDGLFVVVNAGCRDQDIAHMQKHLSGRCEVRPLPDQALLALQGPQAVTALSRLNPGVAQLVFMTGGFFELDGIPTFVTRSGYTGEDGYEISVAADRSVELARKLLAQPEVMPIGLGARDSLRLEAGLCLYGHDIDTTTTPVEASLTWAIQKVRRAGGARAGGYPGAAVIDRQFAEGAARKRVGLVSSERMPVREGAKLVNADGQEIGVVTSGTLGPTVGKPVALAYVQTPYAALGTELFAEVRGKRTPMTVSSTPFTPNGYFRG
ncbi:MULTISPECIES: glycine cleavage system aminomethyltransferase GcvT [unclassified Roseateles]|jgi:aminomethyltransferase|uniref:glycine cleavage system aminomethyltransferase GcvT n=1 Tax=unclassified Roseateles TaxID=2626991 RepID=UPI00160F9130|nr:glycine cleavage system aminomethyltransferase GcvT [Mitsuaria sp. BK037]MBB3280753.1 aminomethyltransferase [Mitsuaria sp. BK037]